MLRNILSLLLCSFLVFPLKSLNSASDVPYIFIVDASTKEERTVITSLGIAIEETHEKFVVGMGREEQIQELKQKGFKFSVRSFPAFLLDFPPHDSDYHNLSELEEELILLEKTYPSIAKLFVIGKSVEGRNLYMMRITASEYRTNQKPGIVFLGTHHAREHLSTEVPFFLMKYLMENYGKDAKLTQLIKEREIWIMPMVNPDGADYDIGGTKYRYWRKNRQHKDANYVHGVDLNRNYGFKWGGDGSSSNMNSEIYRGSEPFSEPETKAIKTFIESHQNITTLLTYHTFSELILYPWGHKYDDIEDSKALKVHQTMAQTMAQMTGYTPEPSSDLYLVSGDTTDWAFGEHGIISFTFELSPASWSEGNFYLPAEKIQEVVKNNLMPAMYLIEYADDPYRVLSELRPQQFFTVPTHWPPIQ